MSVTSRAVAFLLAPAVGLFFGYYPRPGGLHGSTPITAMQTV